jgi:hypothetical protein
MSMSKTASATTRKRGRGTTPIARKASRAAFKAWDTRRKMKAAERRATKRKATKRSG